MNSIVNIAFRDESERQILVHFEFLARTGDVVTKNTEYRSTRARKTETTSPQVHEKNLESSQFTLMLCQVIALIHDRPAIIVDEPVLYINEIPSGR